MSKVLLVGGAGYVGSVLTEELLKRGYAVKVVDRLFFGEEGLREVRDRVDLVVADMRALDPSVLDDIDCVINVAGLSNDPTAEYHPKANREMNALATQSLAKACKSRGIERLVFASTCSVYDLGVGYMENDVLQDEASAVAPKAAYSRSKYEAERLLADMVDDTFCPVILRLGTVFGFSPRMRYDLVVNAFVKDALSSGRLTLHYGGEMWRPLVDVHDVARAFITCLQAEAHLVRGEIFNLVQANYRIAELALRVKEALKEVGVQASIQPDYGYEAVRSYRVSAKKIDRVLGFRPVVTVEDAVKDMVRKIPQYGATDFDSPRYYNIRWMKLLEEALQIVRLTGTVFESPNT